MGVSAEGQRSKRRCVGAWRAPGIAGGWMVGGWIDGWHILFRPLRFDRSGAGAGRKQSSGPLETSCGAIRYRNPPCDLRREGLCRRVRERGGTAAATHSHSSPSHE